MVRLIIDGIVVDADEGDTILAAAEKVGVRIPTLCVLKDVVEPGACRVCVVEVEGEERLPAACRTLVEEGMVVDTTTQKVIEARRCNVQLMLSKHRTSCTTCVRNTTCDLQDLAASMNMGELPYAESHAACSWPEDFPLQRDNSKCIMCLRCVGICRAVQSCGVWDMVGTGPHARVDVRAGSDIAGANCALCGQCVTHCPVGALSARDDTARILAAIADPELITVVDIAPAVRSAWGETLGYSKEEATERRMVHAMRKLGFDFVFDANYAADLTIMEEGTELVHRVRNAEDSAWPMFTSCCPGWVRFVKMNYPEFLPNLSTAKSPHQMLGAITKTFFAESIGCDPEKIFTVSTMPCLAKKYEAAVPQLGSGEAGADIDAVITTREFERLLKLNAIDVATLEEAEWDYPFGLSTGAGVLFGRSGGVMEAALRSAGYLLAGVDRETKVLSSSCVSEAGATWVEKQVQIDGACLDIAVASGLGNARALLEAIKGGDARYDFVEVMACPGGCVNGGGQPITNNKSQVVTRNAVIDRLDEAAPLRESHENPDVIRLYEDFLGAPLSKTSHKLLHTDQATWDIN